MKTFYTILLSALAGSAVAGNIQTGLQPSFTPGVRINGLEKKAPVKISKEARLRRAPMKKISPEDIITNPAGEEKIYFRNAEGFGMDFFYMPIVLTGTGIAQKMRFDGDDVYMYSPVYTYPTDSWIKGHVTDEGMEFPLPQTIYREYDFDPEYPEWSYEQYYEINIFQLNHDDYDGDFYDYLDDDIPNSIILTRHDDGTYGYEPVLEDCYDAEYDIHYKLPRYIVAVTTCWGDPEYDPQEWSFYGDFYTSIAPFDETPVVAPSSVDFQTWTVVTGNKGYNAEVGFEGTDVYFRGLFSNLPDLVVKGSIEDGKVLIPSGQYVGINEQENLFCFFFAGDMEASFDEELWNTRIDIDIEEYGVLEYDEASHRMTTSQGFVLFTSEDAYMASGYVQTPTIMIQPDDISKIPARPEITDYLEFGYYGDYCMVQFITSTLDDEGYWLGPNSDFSYRFICDGKPVIFEPGEDYPYMEETMEWIPYDWTDDWTVMLDQELKGNLDDHVVSIHEEAKEYMALQVRYVDPKDGKEYLAEPEAFWGVMTGVDGMEEDSAEAECFNLQGMRIQRPADGICIIRKGGKVSKQIVR